MLALAHVKNDKPHNVVSITRHACFKKAGPAVQSEDPVDFVCHELLKPLAVINHSAKLLAGMALGNIEQGLVEKIALSCNTAMQYSRSVQQANRLGRIMMNAQEFQPDVLVEDLAATVRDFAFLNGAELETGVAGTVPKVLVAPDQRIVQLLGIFLGNAIKNSHGKTIKLTVKGQMGAEGFMADFRVETQLQEMTEEAIDQISTFEAAHAHIATLFCGRGVGMASCKGLAARIGGHIAVSSSGGRSVAIDLVIPCKMPKTYVEPLLLVKPWH